MRINAEKLDATLLAIAEGRRGDGPIVRCKRCHRRHPRRQPCDEALAAERERKASE